MDGVKDFLTFDRGYGSGDGSGYGNGNGNGNGNGVGSGYGDGYGNGFGIKSINGSPVYVIDSVPTILYDVRHGFGVGAILRNDLTLNPCYIAKSGGQFAHGETPRKAMEALRDKLCDGMSEEERLAAFWECHNRTDKYSGRDLWHWHHRLTGSCEMGRNQFAQDRGIDIDNSAFAVEEFIELCKDSYGGRTIQKLEETI